MLPQLMGDIQLNQVISSQSRHILATGGVAWKYLTCFVSDLHACIVQTAAIHSLGCTVESEATIAPVSFSASTVFPAVCWSAVSPPQYCYSSRGATLSPWTP